jgi:hypothetical protein
MISRAMTDGASLVFLGCRASERRADDWLPIAETIEFLRASE